MVITKLKTIISDVNKLEIKLFFGRTAIIVYQMGKVGSTTVYFSVKDALPFIPVFHVHFLSHSALKEQEIFYNSVGKTSNQIRHLRHGNFLRKKIDKSAAIHWKIITMVRDPVIREISTFFQKKEKKFPTGIDTAEIIKILQNHFNSFDESTDFACNWFDRELRSNFKIDVYDFDFDKEKGYQIIREKDQEILIIRLEDLNNCFQAASREFLEINKPISVLSENVAARKQYKEQYLEVVNTLKIPRDVCELIYSSKYIKHFYSDDMIDNFIQQWTKE